MATQYNIKTGADSSSYFSREVTQADSDATESTIGLIKESDTNDIDVYEYPVLVRRTGDSLKGTTESIESNELRKGRTKSAPRKGNSSSEGSLDFEFSPETYDDILEAAFRNYWKEWKSDTNSETNLDKKTFDNGYFASKEMDGTEVKDKDRLLLGNTTSGAVIAVSSSMLPTLEIAELSCGTKDIRYDVLKEYGGVDGEDLYQDFEHLSVNTLDMSVTPGQIVTGSFGFMGANNPELVQVETADTFVAASDQTVFNVASKPDTINYVKVNDTYKTVTTDYTYNAATGDVTLTSAASAGDKVVVSYAGITEKLTSRFKNAKNGAAVKDYIDNLPEKGTSTDQYTAQQGFLYINGERVRYGSNLSLNLNNGLEKTFAIFEKDSIATSPLSLDITGSLGAYLIKGYSEKLYNMATNDKDVEVLFCFQDKEKDPTALYVVQIFKTKFTDTDISSGAENLEVTLPFQSFEERAIRMFRIRTRRVKTMTAGAVTPIQTITGDGSTKTFPITSKPYSVVVTVNGTKTDVTYTASSGEVTFTTAPTADDVVKVYSATAFKETYTGDGTKTEFTVTDSPEKVSLVTVDGTVATDYTYDSGKITFKAAPAIDAVINVYIPAESKIKVTATLTSAPSDWSSNKPTVTYKIGTEDTQSITITGDLSDNGFSFEISCVIGDSVAVTVVYNGNTVTKTYTVA